MKITLAQIKCVAGDIDGNVKKIVEAAHKAKASTLVIFPELSVCGIPSYDMLKSPDFVERCEKALDKIAAECENIGLLVGCPVGKFNAAVYMFQGQRKVFKKKYLEDFEKDIFEPSDADELLQIGCHKYAVTIGKDLANTNDDEFLLTNRVDELMPLAPDVIINIGADKCGVNRSRTRRNELRQNVLKTERPLVFVNNVASKEEATFDGGSMIFGYESYVVASAPFFEEAVVDVNLECLISMKHEDEQQDYVL
ncbi:MAG: hypothetical protein J6T53_03455 [Bacteroidales bacterium]|nr:hypothetical protein [Bacteroidales bacterium]